jgi:hypothetical protein
LRGGGFRQFQHFERAGAVRQAANEAALLERHHEAVDAGFGAQVERVLHLVEGGGDAGFLEALVDETQQLALFLGQHWLCLGSVAANATQFGRSMRRALKQIMNMLTVRVAFRKGV